MYPKVAPKIMKKALIEIQNSVNFGKSQNFPAYEHVFEGSIKKSFRKELLLHQVKYDFRHKTSYVLGSAVA